MGALRDPNLFTFECKQGDEEVRLYAEKIGNSGRFFRCHSLDYASAADRAVSNLITASSKIDRLWLPSALLQRMSTWGSFLGLKTEHDRSRLKEIGANRKLNLDEEDVQLKLNVRGPRLTRKLLKFINGDADLADRANLSGILLKRWAKDSSAEDEPADQLFALEEIKYDGKFTARGTDIDCHIGILNSTTRRYAEAIDLIESRFIRSENRKPLGDPIVYKFSQDIDVEAFCKLAFSAAAPFFISGTRTKLASDAFRVIAVDMHSGGRLKFEIFRRFIRMYLYPGCCGNSALRFLTNLERHVSAQVELLDHQERMLIDFAGSRR